MKTQAQKLIMNAYNLGGKEYKYKLEQAFPELFTPFKNGDWIKHNNGALLRITDFEKTEAYGFNLSGEWLDNSKFYSFKTNPEHWQKATEIELTAAFKKEFEKRGFKEGVKFKSLYTEGAIGNFNGLDFEDFFDDEMIEMDGQMIYSENYVIYQDGVFAEIVEEPKTIEQRLEIVEQFINEFKNKSK